MKSYFLQYSIPELIEKVKNHKITHSDLVNETIEAFSRYEKQSLAWEVFESNKLIQASKKADSSFQNRGYPLAY